MSEPVKIICPLCYSSNLNMYMEGLNSNIAGSMTMPAGNVDSNNMELKCNACGHTFKPGDGKLSQEPDTQNSSHAAPVTGTQPDILHGANMPDPEEVLSIIQTHGKINAIKFVKDNTGWGLKESKDYVDSLDGRSVVPGMKKGCFIATACYGDYDTPEVLRLRQYRDQTLSASLPGRLFIRLYYLLSPPLAHWLSRSEQRRAWVRRHFLTPLLRWLDR